MLLILALWNWFYVFSFRSGQQGWFWKGHVVSSAPPLPTNWLEQRRYSSCWLTQRSCQGRRVCKLQSDELWSACFGYESTMWLRLENAIGVQHSKSVIITTVVAKEIRNNHFGPRLWFCCDVLWIPPYSANFACRYMYSFSVTEVSGLEGCLCMPDFSELFNLPQLYLCNFCVCACVHACVHACVCCYRFVRDDGKLSRLQRVFAKLYSLDQVLVLVVLFMSLV